MQYSKTTSCREVDQRLPPGFCSSNKTTKHERRIHPSSTNIERTNRPYKTFSNEETNRKSVRETKISLPPHLPRSSSTPKSYTSSSRQDNFDKDIKMRNSSPKNSARSQPGSHTSNRTPPADKRLKEDSSGSSRSNSRNKQCAVARSQTKNPGIESSMTRRKQHSVSDSPMEIDGLRSLTKQESSTKGAFDVLRLRLFLAEKMSKAVECSPKGGHGIPVDHFLQEFQELIGRSAISALIKNTSFEKLLLAKCSDLVTLQELKVGEKIMKGCVPSAEFCQNAKRIEKEVKKVMETAQKAPPRSVETSSEEDQQKKMSEEVKGSQEQECWQKDKLVFMIKELLQKTMKAILSNSCSFPSIQEFERLFEEKYNQKLNPEIAGYQTVQRLLRGCDLDDLVRFVNAEDNVFLVPSNQVYIAHQEEERKRKTAEEFESKEIAGREEKSDLPASLESEPARVESVSLAGADVAAGDLPAMIKSDNPVEKEELEEKLKVLETTDKSVQVVDLSTDQEMYGGMREVDFEQFDGEILDRLRELFLNVVCKDGHPILLNRLPMYFLKLTGTILDYHKYGYISLADIVALLEDIVQVVESEKGKMIVPVKRTIRRRTGQRLAVGGESSHTVHTHLPPLAVVETQPSLTGSMAVEYGTAYSPQLSPKGDQVCWSTPSAVAGWGVNIHNPATAHRTPLGHPVLVPNGGGVRSATMHDPALYRTSLPRTYQHSMSAPVSTLQQNVFQNPHPATGKRF